MQLLEIRKHADMEFGALARRHHEVVGSLNDSRRIPSYDVLVDGVDLAESLKYSPRLLIPNRYFFGTQLPEEYETRKRKQVEAHLAKEGITYLLRHPVIGCALIDPLGATIAIFDGHHRMRYAPEPRYGIYLIPTIVALPADLVQILHSAGKLDISAEAFTAHMRENVDNTLSAFDSRMPSDKRPSIIEGITDIGQLKDIFRQF